MAEQDQEQLVHVRISRASDIVWEGEARSVSSENAMGDFDILPLHANMITVIDNKPITVVDATGNTEQYTFKQSVVYVNQNAVHIFVNLI